MKNYAGLLSTILFVFILAACSTTPQQPDDGIINPGDRIGDFTILKGDRENVFYMTQFHCPFEEATSTETCEVAIGTKINVSQGFFRSFDSEQTLDEIWSGITYEMTIEGYPVDLQSFGTDEFQNQVVGTVRVWNVVITADKPGKVTAHSTGKLGDESIEYTAVINFIEP